MLRDSYLKTIYSTINSKPFFSFDDFRCSQIVIENGFVFELTYKHEPDYFFKATVYDTEIPDWLETSPGSVRKIENRTFQFNQLLLEVKTWLDNLQADLESLPLLRRLKAIEDRMNSVEETINGISDSYFTYIEGTELKNRLDKLEQELIDRLTNEMTDNERLAEEVESLHNEIQTLKIQIDVLNKRGWITKFLYKTFNWLEKHPNSVNSIVGVTKTLLTNGQENIQNELVDLLNNK